MAFTNNVPQANQRIKDTQQPILDNFSALGAVLNGVDNLACLFPQIADPNTAVNQVALYQKSNELYWRRANNGAVVNMTERVPANNGYTRLPSGITIIWSKQTVASLGSAFGGNIAGVPNNTITNVYNTILTVRDVPALAVKPVAYLRTYNPANNNFDGNVYRLDTGANYPDGVNFEVNIVIIGS